MKKFGMVGWAFLVLSFGCSSAKKVSAPDPAAANLTSTGEPVQSGYSGKIQETIRAHENEVKDCYEPVVKKNPEVMGHLAAYFEIDANGKVTSARIQKTTLNHSKVENCVLKRLKTWTFPKPDIPVPVKTLYPFLFMPFQEKD
ncbi:MAG: AgmX/PglI C-terminal domain-containing protein [Bdellovibrionales bacterium]|nr:AgmX/PglI C-terminal domain-containing protein [Bdellovibrionales bacterium]